MAIEKKVTLPNGVVVNYHRVVSITNIINNMISVEVASYISESERNKEIQALDTGRKSGQYPEIYVYVYTEYKEVPYSEKFDVNDAYNLIKSYEEYKGAKDV